jgi:long-chain acyl-CoA synthetase
MLDSIGRIPAEAAERFGDKPALITPGRQLSFHELNALSNRCANALVGLGVKAGDRVTLYSGNSWEWIVAYYGALKAGAVINPINVMLTPEEVGFVARDCGASVVLASHEKALSIEHIKDPSGVREIIAFGDEGLPEGMSSFGDLLGKYPEEFEVGEIHSQSLSTIAYTSGTTGHPKGACLSHHNVLLCTRGAAATRW